MTVRTRAALLAAAVMFVASLLGGVALVRVVRTHLVQADITTARLRAQDVLTLATAGDVPSKLSFPGEENAATQVLDDRGKVIAGTENVEGDAAISRLRPEPGESDSEVAGIGALDDTQRYALVAVTSEKAPHRTVLAATSLEATEETVATLRRALMIGLPLLVLLVGFTTRFLVGRALRPVGAITDEVADITGRGLSRRVPEPSTGDEIAELAVTMNGMLGRLEAASDRQQRFVADASHELRSPLASARTTLEVAALHPGSRQELLAAINDALIDHDRLDRLTIDLLTLARPDESRIASSLEPVDVDDVVRSLVERRTEGSIDLELHAGVRTVSEGALSQILTNLLDNAARHRETRSAVTTAVDDGELIVRVDDDGPGIPIEDRERIFEPFTRLDEARVADEGTGLGLAIVKELVVASGGSVRVEAGDLGGASFVVRLP